MGSRRTQIYLDDELRARVDRARAREGKSMADVVRTALERYLDDEERVRRPLSDDPPDWIGAWAGKELDRQQIREEIEERAKRLGY